MPIDAAALKMVTAEAPIMASIMYGGRHVSSSSASLARGISGRWSHLWRRGPRHLMVEGIRTKPQDLVERAAALGPRQRWEKHGGGGGACR